MKTPQKEAGEITDRQNPAGGQQMSDEAAVWRDTVIEQIVSIRDTGDTNMLNFNTVRTLAAKNGFDELADFISESKGSYLGFILTGNSEFICKAS